MRYLIAYRPEPMHTIGNWLCELEGYDVPQWYYVRGKAKSFDDAASARKWLDEQPEETRNVAMVTRLLTHKEAIARGKAEVLREAARDFDMSATGDPTTRRVYAEAAARLRFRADSIWPTRKARKGE